MLWILDQYFRFCFLNRAVYTDRELNCIEKASECLARLICIETRPSSRSLFSPCVTRLHITHIHDPYSDWRAFLGLSMPMLVLKWQLKLWLTAERVLRFTFVCWTTFWLNHCCVIRGPVPIGFCNRVGHPLHRFWLYGFHRAVTGATSGILSHQTSRMDSIGYSDIIISSTGWRNTADDSKQLYIASMVSNGKLDVRTTWVITLKKFATVFHQGSLCYTMKSPRV